MKSESVIFGALLAALCINGANAADEPKPEKGVFGILVENDWFNNSDHNYTNGIELTYTTAPQDTPQWLVDTAHWLPFFTATGKGDVRTRYAIGQTIFLRQQQQRQSAFCRGDQWRGQGARNRRDYGFFIQSETVVAAEFLAGRGGVGQSGGDDDIEGTVRIVIGHHDAGNLLKLIALPRPDAAFTAAKVASRAVFSGGVA